MILDCELRPATPNDVNFILSAWIQGLHTKCPEYQLVPNDVFYAHMNGILNNVLNEATTTVACDREREDQLFGFVCYSYLSTETVLHWIYTKKTYSKMGVATKLFNSINPRPFVCDFMSNIFPQVKDKYEIIYNPFLRDIYYANHLRPTSI